MFLKASTGDVKGEKPGMLDFVGRAKYDSWNKNKGLSMVFFNFLRIMLNLIGRSKTQIYRNY